MSNRQARREQTRQSRPTRTPRTGRPAPGKAPRRQRSGPDLFSLPYLLGVSGLIVILAIVFIFVAARGGGSDGDLVKKLQDGHASFPAELAKGATVGKDDAPLKLEVYEDFQCPFCLKYTANQEAQLIEEYVKTGKVQYTYKHYPAIGIESVRAATATQCAADQGKFWDYHNKLYEVEAAAGQATTEKLNVGRFSDNNLKKYAADLGLDAAAFNSCFDSDKYLQTVQDQQRAAKAIGISGTPSFVVNGQPLPGSGAPATMEEWRKVLDQVLTRLTASPTAAANGSPAAAGSPGAAPASPTVAGTPAATATR